MTDHNADGRASGGDTVPVRSDASDVEMLMRQEPAGKKLQLRLWLKLLSCTNLVSSEIRRNLRTEFDVTLPRFDLMAQLYREPEGLRLGELSRRMMVTNGNITGLVEHLAAEGLIERVPVPGDRRVSVVRLSPAGAEAFGHMARAHEGWIKDLFGDLDRPALTQLIDALEQLKSSVRTHAHESDG